jgi:UDP:flavonoid glycosyltransferase YjiC (YdhE family)
MARVLMTTWDGGGNVPPLLHTARALQARGHDVRVLGHAAQAGTFDDAGLAFTPYRHAIPFSRTAPRGPMDIFETFVDGGTGRDVEEALAAEPADVVVADCLILGPLQAAQAAGVPTVSLVHSFHACFWPLVQFSPIAEMGAAAGRVPSELWHAADEVIVTADRALDPAEEAAPNVHWTGVAQPAANPAPRADRTRVLLSLSTVWFEGQQESLQRILDALAELDVSVIATFDASVEAANLRVPANVEARGYVDHAEVMPEVALVIGHGGHATTMRALAHGLPLLIVPQLPMADQAMIGQVLTAHGAALTLPQEAAVEQLRDAIAALLADESYARAAGEIGARLRATDGAAAAAERIEALTTRAPAPARASA